MARSIIAIVGRPNVGKSTLFNRITGQRLAIVEDTPGVTRDRLYANAKWLNRDFILVDTGGLTDENDPIQTQIRKQVQVALEEADAVIMVVDGRESLTASDFQVAGLLRKEKKPIILAVNKIEAFDTLIDAEIYSLGLGEPVLISAEHGKNIGDLLDRVTQELPGQYIEMELDQVRVAFLGRPNVGKSSLVNALLGEERVIVSDQPGTTRDAIDTAFTLNNRHYLLVDTAGIRRKAKVETAVEYYSVLRAIKAVERADVALLVLDATQKLAEQDLKVAGIIKDAWKACIIVVNKWDLVEKGNQTADEFTEYLRREMEFLDYAPVIFVSAKTGQRLTKLLAMVDQVMINYSQRVSTNRLNSIVAEALAVHSPPSSRKGRMFKLYYTSQLKTKPPTFQFTVNDPENMHFSYRRYLENRIRENFEFTGTPLKFEFRSSNKRTN